MALQRERLRVLADLEVWSEVATRMGDQAVKEAGRTCLWREGGREGGSTALPMLWFWTSGNQTWEGIINQGFLGGTKGK